MDAQPASYQSEAALVSSLLDLLGEEISPWGPLATTTEWDYGAGFTDVLARTCGGELIAFEAKLSDWKGAFYQAYRNTAFARLAYVAMPRKGADVASRNPALFVKQGVGLCSVECGRINVVIQARPKDALLPRMRAEALLFLEGREISARNASHRNRETSMRLAPAHAW